MVFQQLPTTCVDTGQLAEPYSVFWIYLPLLIREWCLRVLPLLAYEWCLLVDRTAADDFCDLWHLLTFPPLCQFSLTVGWQHSILIITMALASSFWDEVTERWLCLHTAYELQSRDVYSRSGLIFILFHYMTS